ncbi:hypothetical protein NC796_25125 [Aliifodinibius sp. S!AR15-10]|uniref:hypothetical protein n=1 Tax=Aliifodinibius sp. S!AR15-10 TaxID=2950437 RepID=UPI00285E0A14|nr:hypothetical protein [Aliifodinibius sp. S!AR15-10]MDR8394453.1 hypothetical protein [Aliifodinibius sp. S!AR15-10]
MNQRTCQHCGTDIEHKRTDAKYCSNRCRMRFRRWKKKAKLIGKLIKYCSKIPNHVLQEGNRITAVVIKNANSGKHHEISAEELKNMSNEELKKFIKWKRAEAYAYQFVNNS